MMSDEDPWADAFAAMAGEEVPSYKSKKRDQASLEIDNIRNSTHQSTKEKKRKTRKNQKHARNNLAWICDSGKEFLQSRAYPLPYLRILAQQFDDNRTNDVTQLLPGWKLGALMHPFEDCNKICSKYQASASSLEEKPLFCCCQHCKYSPLCHQLELDVSRSSNEESSDIQILLQLFALQRNARSLTAMISSLKESNVGKKNINFVTLEHSVATTVKELLQKCHRELQRSTYLSASILQEKLQHLIDATQLWVNLTFQQVKKSSKNHAKEDTGVHLTCFESRMNSLIATDAFYHRLYYEQLVLTVRGEISLRRWNGPKAGQSTVEFIPHPHVYFAIPGLAWSCANIRQQVYDGATNEDESSLDPLASLHWYRRQETKLLFYSSGWCTSSEAVRGHWDAQDRYASRIVQQRTHNIRNGSLLDRHETPAHPILACWRDSIRDFPAHLYGYATLPKGSYSRIVEAVQRLFVRDDGERKQHLHRPASLVEMGAGTGFFAYHLRSAGAHVVAFDSSPLPSIETNDVGAAAWKKQSVTNEYHGDTPAFLTIRKGTPISFQGVPHLDRMALVLCYPPPNDTMGEESVQYFMNGGGQCVVHIGEFAGLTGSRGLEELISTQFHCVDRWDCLHWGTDAASVTIWKIGKRETKNKSTYVSVEPLTLCSQCRTKEAVKRCTFARDIAYCGVKCFRSHDSERANILLDQHMLCLEESRSKGGKRLDFNDPFHFISLS